MNAPIEIKFTELDLTDAKEIDGVLAILVGSDGKLDQAARRVNSACRKAITRCIETDAFRSLPHGGICPIAYPSEWRRRGCW